MKEKPKRKPREDPQDREAKAIAEGVRKAFESWIAKDPETVREIAIAAIGMAFDRWLSENRDEVVREIVDQSGTKGD